MHLSENLYWVNGMIYGTLGNVYAIRGKESVTLIDCGEEVALDNIDRALADWGMGDLPIRHVLLTHAHQDHAGSAKRLQERGAKIYIHEADAWQVRQGGLIPETYPGLIWQMTPVEPDVLIKDGDVITIEDFEVKVMGAPGHTNGSVVYVWEHGGKTHFFTGDTCSCDGERGHEVILGWKGSPDYDLPTYLKTLDMLFKFYPDIVLGGHGFPRMQEGNTLLRNACLKAMLELR